MDLTRPAPALRLPRLGAGPSVILLGIAWSGGMVAANRAEIAASGAAWLEALALVLPGGLAMAGVAWATFAAVFWAMLRLMRLRPGSAAILKSLAAATPCLWLAAPALAFLVAPAAGSPALASVFLPAGIGGFLAQLVRALAGAEGGGTDGIGVARAVASVGLAVIFIASLFVLQA